MVIAIHPGGREREGQAQIRPSLLSKAVQSEAVLDPRRLQALHAVATTGSVKEAAAQLGYTSSAISQQITALERETGSVLLEPNGRGVRPTPAGELLAQHATRIFEQLAQAESELIALNAGQLGSLRLASFASA